MAARALKTQQITGFCITASHNPAPDNGVKLVEPSGEMLCQEWEVRAPGVGVGAGRARTGCRAPAAQCTSGGRRAPPLSLTASDPARQPPRACASLISPPPTHSLTHTHTRTSTQAYANELANAPSDGDLARAVLGLLEAEGVAAPGPGVVLIGHDTRPSSPELAEAAAAGVRCLGVQPQMCGLLTTPQLHWMVMSRNRGEPCGEADYHAALAGAYAQLVKGTQPLGQVRWSFRKGRGGMCSGAGAGVGMEWEWPQSAAARVGFPSRLAAAAPLLQPYPSRSRLPSGCTRPSPP